MAANGNGKAFMAGLVGLGVGLGAGLLMAPKSGEEVRSGMKSKLNEAKKTTDTVASRAKKKWREFKEEVKRDTDAKIPDELGPEDRLQ